MTATELTLQPPGKSPLRPLEEIRPESHDSASGAALRGVRAVRGWVHARRVSLAYLAGPLLATGVLTAWNVYRYPFKSTNDDEGTYVAQAWAVENWQEFAHYTYWYDHPPLGWVQIAGWTWITDAFDRVDAVSAGREFMVLLKVVAVTLLFVLVRRLGFHRSTAAAAAALYGVSPLGIQFGRMVFLDNIAMAWVLGALVLAMSPAKRLSAAVGSAFCFGVAVLTKETIVVWLPFLVWLLVRNSDRRTRGFWLGQHAAVLLCVVSVYPLYAVIKNELLPGPGHVDLWSALVWQAFGREAIGNVFTAGVTHEWVRSWFGHDAWLLWGGMAVALPSFIMSRRLRPFAALLILHVLLVIRGGYVPYAFVIAVLPLAAILCAGFGEELLLRVSRLRLMLRRGAYAAVATASAVILAFMVPAWYGHIRPQLTLDANRPAEQALAWVAQNVPRDSWMIVNDSNWVDLVEAGYDPSRVIWFYKVDSDPEVKESLDGLGWRRFDYLIQSDFDLGALGADSDEPTVGETLEHSEVVASFESSGPDGRQHIVQILRVEK
jgi:hypothetical protein